MREHYDMMLRTAECKAERALSSQETDKQSRFFGGFVQPDGVFQAKSTMYAVGTLAAVYCNAETKYYHDAAVLKSALRGVDFVESVQHENGLFDYVTCNFFSAPDTAFCILAWVPHIRYLRKLRDRTEGEETLLRRMERVVQRGGRGLLEGGFHTPNHRWAIASLLACCGRLFDDPELTTAANAYLKEGMDCNGDGEYAEKSAGNYNRVNNDAMILLSESLGDELYEKLAVRNLHLMLTYWEPDGTVFTANSTRFDKDRVCYTDDYYWEYLLLGKRYGDPELLDMANYIIADVKRRGAMAPDFLIEYMVHPELIGYEWPGCGIPTEYSRFYPASGIARVRRTRYTYTVMQGKSNFLHVHNGDMSLAVKLAGSFCEHRAFISEDMARLPDGSFRLTQTMRGWYYLPFEDTPPTSDWWRMDNASRRKKLGPDMRCEAVVRETEDGLDVEIAAEGVSGAPWRVELAFNGAERISSPHLDMPVHGDETIVMRDTGFTVSNARGGISVSPAFGEHRFTEGKEDSEAKTPGLATVYLTAYTPFRRVIHIVP